MSEKWLLLAAGLVLFLGGMCVAWAKSTGSRKAHPLCAHLRKIGFTNRLAVYLVLLLTAGLAGGFVLAVLSIKYQYTGALMCWTVVFTPIGTAVSIVLARIVDKSRDENTGADGEGIKYAAAKAKMSVDSPPI